MPIPAFNFDYVVPPHVGNPTQPAHLSPYPCNTLDLCERFATNAERAKILKGFLAFRKRLHTEGLNQGFQWLDGSFLKDVETRDGRTPNDLDTVTVYWGYDLLFQTQLANSFPEFVSSKLAKVNFSVDHYPFDASASPALVIGYTRYWIQLFSHNRLGVWKGMLQIELNTPSFDQDAEDYLNSLTI